MVATRGKVRIAQLTELFGVSEPTVRKDLTTMEQRGLLKRTHGGAVSVRPPVEQAMASRIAETRSQASISRTCSDPCCPEKRYFSIVARPFNRSRTHSPAPDRVSQC